MHVFLLTIKLVLLLYPSMGYVLMWRLLLQQATFNSVQRKNCTRNFHKTKIGNNSINVNFVFPYICSFLHYQNHMMPVNVKLNVSQYKSFTFQCCKFVLQIFNGTAKTKMAILAFLYCEEFVNNFNGPWCQQRIQRPGKGGREI